MGTPYRMITSHDFSTPTEIYIPNTFTSTDIDIYDRYWKNYIADLYSVNTRVLSVEIYLEDIHDSFKKFYWYNNAVWALSSITDWNPETKICKATLLKVNNKGDYTDYMDITPAVFNAPYGGTELTLNFKKSGDVTAVDWTSNNAWIHDLNGEGSGQFSEDSCTFVIDANTGTSPRTGTITFNWNGKTYVYTITQDGLFVANAVVIGGTCNYTLSTTTFSPGDGRVIITPEGSVFQGDSVVINFLPKDHYHVSLFTINGVSHIDEIVDSRYVIENVHSRLNIVVGYAEDPMFDINIINMDPALGSVSAISTEGRRDRVYLHENVVVTFSTIGRNVVGTFTINGVDYVNEISNNQYTISDVTENKNIIVDFRPDGVYLKINVHQDDAIITIENNL